MLVLLLRVFHKRLLSLFNVFRFFNFQGGFHMEACKVSILLLLFLLELQVILAQGRCKVPHFKTGCYRDVRFHEALEELLFQDRCEQCPKYGGELIDWSNYGAYLNRLACRCASAAKAKGYTHFGLQFYGLCYSAKGAASKYTKYGISNRCVDKDQIACDNEKPSECVGLGNANYVYRI